MKAGFLKAGTKKKRSQRRKARNNAAAQADTARDDRIAQHASATARAEDHWLVVGTVVEAKATSGKWWEAIITRVRIRPNGNGARYDCLVQDGCGTMWPGMPRRNIRRPAQDTTAFSVEDVVLKKLQAQLMAAKGKDRKKIKKKIRSRTLKLQERASQERAEYPRACPQAALKKKKEKEKKQKTPQFSFCDGLHAATATMRGVEGIYKGVYPPKLSAEMRRRAGARQSRGFRHGFRPVTPTPPRKRPFTPRYLQRVADSTSHQKKVIDSRASFAAQHAVLFPERVRVPADETAAAEADPGAAVPEKSTTGPGGNAAATPADALQNSTAAVAPPTWLRSIKDEPLCEDDDEVAASYERSQSGTLPVGRNGEGRDAPAPPAPPAKTDWAPPAAAPPQTTNSAPPQTTTEQPPLSDTARHGADAELGEGTFFSITVLPEFAQASFEELRAEHYRREEVAVLPSFEQLQAMPPDQRESVIAAMRSTVKADALAYYQYANHTMQHQYANHPWALQQWWPQGVPSPATAAKPKGSALPLERDEALQSITGLPELQHLSFEELRSMCPNYAARTATNAPPAAVPSEPTRFFLGHPVVYKAQEGIIKGVQDNSSENVTEWTYNVLLSSGELHTSVPAAEVGNDWTFSFCRQACRAETAAQEVRLTGQLDEVLQKLEVQLLEATGKNRKKIKKKIRSRLAKLKKKQERVAVEGNGKENEERGPEEKDKDKENEDKQRQREAEGNQAKEKAVGVPDGAAGLVAAASALASRTLAAAADKLKGVEQERAAVEGDGKENEERGPEEKEKDNAFLEALAAPSNFWACTRCTLYNAPINESCVICGAVHPDTLAKLLGAATAPAGDGTELDPAGASASAAGAQALPSRRPPPGAPAPPVPSAPAPAHSRALLPRGTWGPPPKQRPAPRPGTTCARSRWSREEAALRRLQAFGYPL